MGKTKRSISRANDPKTLTPAAIYTTNNHINNEQQRRAANSKGKGTMNAIGRKMVNRTIEIDGDLE